MSSAAIWNSKAERRSPFFRDLSTPISAHRSGGATAGSGGGRFATPSQAAAVSALWRENFGGGDPPPPPVFTLEDRVDFSPEPGLIPPPLHSSSSPSPHSRTPPPASRDYISSSPSALKLREEASGPPAVGVIDEGLQLQRQQSAGSFSWWSPAKGGGSGDREDKGRGSPVDGVVEPGALIVLPPTREVAKPEMQRNSLPIGERLDEQEWVTVYGFSAGDTNLVLQEFEKCGVILKHVLGPRDANWMHILYQSRCDAQKALGKHGTQISSVLIIGVKPVDPQQRQYLSESLESNHIRGFMNLEPAAKRSFFAPSLIGVAAQPHLRQNGTAKLIDKSHQSKGAIASPAKSLVSKVMDLMFGI